MQSNSDVARKILPCKALLLSGGMVFGIGVSHLCKYFSRSRTREEGSSHRSTHEKPGGDPRISENQASSSLARLTKESTFEHELRVLIDALPALVWRASPDGKQDYANRRFLEYLGRPLDLSVGDGWLQFLHPEDIEPTLQTWAAALASGSSYHHTYRFRRADGAYRWFESVAEPMRDENGRVVRWCGVLFEFDDQRQAEDALRFTRASLNRAAQVATVAELSASIAHEINQPLAAILANSEAYRTWLSKSPPDIDRALLTAEKLVRDGKAAAEVVLRIRRLFQQAVPNKQLLNFNDLVGEVVSLMSDDIAKRQSSVLTELDTAIPLILGDRTHLQQVLTNLISNAIDSMDEVGQKTTVTIQSSSTEETLRVDVRDSGSGSPDLSMMFEPFFTTKGKGMGMGLAICRAIIDSHGGRLWADRNEDCGLTVSFTLPVASEA